MVMEYIYTQSAEIPSGRKWLFCHETDSTMDTARLISLFYRNISFVLRTDFQRRGRGRKPGRNWKSAAGENLLFTYALCNDELKLPLQLVPLAAGAAVAGAAEKRGLEGRIQLKWPNDVLVDGCKAGGILCESRRWHVLVGIGLNVNQEYFADAYFWKAASLFSCSGRKQDVQQLLYEIIDNMHSAEAEKHLVSEINRRLYGLGKVITCVSGEDRSKVTGVLSGIQEDGALLLSADDGMHYLYSGEILPENEGLENS